MTDREKGEMKYVLLSIPALLLIAWLARYAVGPELSSRVPFWRCAAGLFVLRWVLKQVGPGRRWRP